jgi:methane monooxygenase PmoA-like
MRLSAVAEYVTAPEIDPALAPRPYLHPVRTLAGTVVTDAFPADHEWHLGVGLAMPDVSGTNLWGGRSYVPGQGYVWLADHGRIEHVGWRGDQEELRWLDPGGRTLLAEVRDITAEEVPGGWRLTLATGLTNPGAEPVELRSPAVNGRGEGAGYGGFFWRLPPLRAPSIAAGPLRTEESINGSAQPLLIVSDRGRYTLEFTGLAGADRWFVRLAEYPGVGVAWAFDRPLRIAPGDTFRRRYRVVVRDQAS